MADESQPGPQPGQQPGQQPGRQPTSGAPGTGSSREDAPTEWIASSQPPPDDRYGGGGGVPPGERDAGSGGGRRRWIAPVAAVAAVALIGGGAFAAYTVLSGGGAQPDEAIPSSAIAYARIDLDPSADQKINMVRLLRNVPEFEEETGITSDTDDLRKRLFDLAMEDSSGCEDIDYDDDVAPWIGDRAAAAAIPADDEGDDPDAVFALQVSDEDAARDGIEALIECGQASDESSVEGAAEEAGLAFVGDYALLAETQDLADGFATDAENESLADSDAFSADMEALDGEGVASFWLDLDGLMSLAEGNEPEAAEALDCIGAGELGTVSGALRAESDAIELAVASNGDMMSIGTSTEPVSDVQQLPDSTMAAVGFTGGRELVDSMWQKFGDIAECEPEDLVGPGGLDSLADQIQAQYGIALPEDLSVLFGDELTLALDSEGLSLDPATGAPDPSTINVGARMRTDADAVRDLVTRIQDLAAATAGVSFEIADADYDGGIVLASNDDYAQSLADGGDLGDSDVFGDAVADSDSATSVLFIDLDKVSDVATRIADETGQPMSSEDSETLDVFKAFGMSTAVDGDYTHVTMRLVFD